MSEIRPRHPGGLQPLAPGHATHIVALRLPAPQYEELNELVKAQGLTPSKILREALTEYLERRCRQQAAA